MSIANISGFYIYPSCDSRVNPSSDCEHKCNITLLDGQTQGIFLDASEIAMFIANIDRKIVKGNISHFVPHVCSQDDHAGLNVIIADIFKSKKSS